MTADDTTRFERLFDNTLVPMMLLELVSGSILEVNQAAADFYGYSRDDMRGMPVSTIETMSPEEIATLMETQLAEMTENRRVLTHRLADGSLRDVMASVGILPDPASPIAYVILFDVTAWRNAIAELDEHRARLERILAGE